MKNKKGSITLFVLFAGLFFIMFLGTMLMYGSIRRQSQIEATKKTEEIYSSQNQDEIYQNYFAEGAVPIYTKEQLFQIASGKNVQINEEGGKMYNFSADATYVIKNDIEFDYNGVWQMPDVAVVGNKRIHINDTSRTDGIYHFYDYSNNYEEYRTGKIGWSENTVYTIAIEGERLAPIPDGFVSSKVTSEDEIKEGLVIYEKTDTIKKVDSSNHDTALTSSNQYVWIPVDDITDMVMCSVCGGGVRNLVFNETNETLKCTSTHAEGTTPKLVGKLYSEYVSGGNTTTSVTYQLNGTSKTGTVHTRHQNFEQSNQTYNTNLVSHEPAVVTGNSDGTGTIYDGAENAAHGYTNAAVFLIHLETEYANMAKSVAKYGGFYISRYEIGIGGTSFKGQNVFKNDTTANDWYGIYNAIEGLNEEGTSTVSQMIWGSQYDQVMKYLEENPTNEPYKGHTSRVSLTGYVTSGNAPADEMSNIFDLEGNYMEWTAEAVRQAR